MTRVLEELSIMANGMRASDRLDQPQRSVAAIRRQENIGSPYELIKEFCEYFYIREVPTGTLVPLCRRVLCNPPPPPILTLTLNAKRIR